MDVLFALKIDSVMEVHVLFEESFQSGAALANIPEFIVPFDCVEFSAAGNVTVDTEELDCKTES